MPLTFGSAQLEHALQLTEMLSAQLGTATCLWVNEGAWCLFDEQSVIYNQIDWPALLSSYDLQQPEPIVHDTELGIAAIIVPIQNKTKCSLAITLTIAAAQVPLVMSCIKLCQELIALRIESSQHHEVVNAYTFQVTSDFEELTWLREITSHLDICDLNNPLPVVANKILPQLRELIHAECLVMLMSAQPGTAPIEPLVLGNLPITLDECEQLISKMKAQALIKPVVRNSPQRWQSLEEVRGLQNYILIPISKSNFQFGWILALNKTFNNLQADEDYQIASGLNAWEYGTFEAGLLSIAASLLGTHACNVNLFQEQAELVLSVVHAIINAIDAKDPYTCGHSERVASFAKLIAEQMGYNSTDCEQVYMSGLLHDVGKIGIPDHILGKPGKLTEEEYAVIKKHPEIGYTILRHLKPISYVLPGVLHHHEAVNGMGYPLGLAGDQIPWQGRVLAVADAYDAMTSNRPYRNGMPHTKAEQILREGSGKTWDHDAVEAFFRVCDQIQASKDLEELRRQVLLAGQTGDKSLSQMQAVTHAVANSYAI